MGWGKQDDTVTIALAGLNAKFNQETGEVMFQNTNLEYPNDNNPWWSVSKALVEYILETEKLVNGPGHHTFTLTLCSVVAGIMDEYLQNTNISNRALGKIAQNR